MATLTLHQGECAQEYAEHPIEIARRAIIAAADLETAQAHETDDANRAASHLAWASAMARFASALPNRPRVSRVE